MALSALSIHAQLPDKGTAADLRGKTKFYLDAEADQAKMIRKVLKGSDLVEVARLADAEFVLEFRILSQKEKAELGGMFPASNTVRRAQLTAYYLRAGDKIIAYEGVKEGGQWSRPAALSLSKRFLEARVTTPD